MKKNGVQKRGDVGEEGGRRGSGGRDHWLDSGNSMMRGLASNGSPGEKMKGERNP